MIPAAARATAPTDATATVTAAYLRMNGPQIYRWATQMMARAAEEVIRTSNITPEQIDLFIPHQANLRIIENTAKRLGIDSEKVFSNVGRYGNTSAASIPIALCEAIAAGRVDRDDNIVLSSFGAGLSWAALALRWTVATGAKRSRWVAHPARRGRAAWPPSVQPCGVRNAECALRSTSASAATATSGPARPASRSACPTCAGSGRSFVCSGALVLPQASASNRHARVAPPAGLCRSRHDSPGFARRG